jgi:hypothetical protein
MKMKKTLCIIFMAVMIINACQQKPKTAPVDQEAAKVAVVATLDKYHSGMIAKDAKIMMTMLADNGFYCGSDPKEFYDKPTLSNEMTKMFADTTLKISYSINKREIRIAADGNSAIAVDQNVMNFISPKIPVRWVFHLIKTENNWLIDFFSVSLIPHNEDIGKINKALE